MTAKERVGGLAVFLGIVGLGFASGGVEAAETLNEWIVTIGTAAASLMLMQLGVWIVNDEV